MQKHAYGTAVLEECLSQQMCVLVLVPILPAHFWVVAGRKGERSLASSCAVCGVRCGLCLVLTSWQVKKRNRENCTAICIIGVYSIENRVLHFVERWKTSECFFSKRAFGPSWDPNGIQAGPRLGSNERASSRNVVYQAQFLLECKYRFSFPYSAQRKKKKKLRQQDIRQREWGRKKKYFRRSIQATCIIIEQ